MFDSFSSPKLHVRFHLLSTRSQTSSSRSATQIAVLFAQHARNVLKATTNWKVKVRFGSAHVRTPMGVSVVIGPGIRHTEGKKPHLVFLAGNCGPHPSKSRQDATLDRFHQSPADPALRQSCLGHKTCTAGSGRCAHDNNRTKAHPR